MELLNQFATIYTAGVEVTDPTELPGGSFVVPVLRVNGTQGNLGAKQEVPFYPVQYTLGGGNVSIFAQENIEHETQNNQGVVVPDSEKELPDNWLDRRGYVDPLTGQFGTTANGDIASTTWWIDFSNFFEGVGALGGGNVSMVAGRDVDNVDAVVPTNARMTYQTTGGNTQAADQTLYELGGGDLLVRAGDDINGGVYYVERGQGVLHAGNEILTNSTRSPSLTTIVTPSSVDSPDTWLPTTLFLGDGSFDVIAGGDLLLGPVANPFLLPEGVNNTFWDKTYFSTYAATDSVNVSSLNGTVTLEENAAVPGSSSALPALENWLQAVDLLSSAPASVSLYQPWLRLDETSVQPFALAASLLPPALNVAAFSGDVNVNGNLILFPSPVGTLDLLAAGSINGLQPNGATNIAAVNTMSWGSSLINLSDADPATLPGINSPYAYQELAGVVQGNSQITTSQFLSFLSNYFNDSGSILGNYAVLQTQQALHDPGLLHADDPDPVHIYAESGDASDFTLFSGKVTDVIAGGNIADVALYIQNDNADDVSMVVAGGDLLAYDPNSPSLIDARATGNILDFYNSGVTLPAWQNPNAGDIQIAGPGTLEVLAGRNLNLGVGPTIRWHRRGITSIGNGANPYLPFGGADIIAGAGIGGSFGLGKQQNRFYRFHLPVPRSRPRRQ